MLTKDTGMNSSTFDKLRALIFKNTGITVQDNRMRLLESRLKGRLRELKETNYSNYYERLTTDADEMQELINRVTTNETYCYRTPRIWDFFETEFLPEFQAMKLPRALKAWSAASSSGEEAHTIGIVCEEQRLSVPGFDYSVFGTDISSRVIAKAEAGLYIGKPIERLKKEKPELFAKHMKGDPKAGYSVTREIKSRLTFKRHNLLKALGRAHMFDIVFLRNVLIYFAKEEQEQILRNMGKQMHPHAALIIGESETLTQLDTDFEQIAPLIYRKTTP